MSHFLKSWRIGALIFLVIFLFLSQSYWRWWGVERNDFRTELTGAWLVSGYEVRLSEYHLFIEHVDTSNVVFKTLRGERFIDLSNKPVLMSEERGMVSAEVDLGWSFCDQVVQRVEADQDSLDLVGYLDCGDEQTHYRFSIAPDIDSVDIVISSEGSTMTSLAFEMPGHEAAVGFGAQFSRVNMRGTRLPIVVSEQGIGRGDQPLTALVDIVADAGGSWDSTYAPIPWFFTNLQRGVWLMNEELSWFDFTKSDRAVVSVASQMPRFRFYVGRTPKALISKFTADSGRMRRPPEWINDGLILGVQGGSEITQQKYAQLRGHDVPVTALWIQDWVGQRTTTFGKQLWWNWRLDRQHYVDYQQWHSSLNDEGVRVLGYLNPSLVSDPTDDEEDLHALMTELSGFVSNEDGHPLNFLNTSFESQLLNLDHQEAMKAWSSVVSQRITEAKFSGWMADFGENYPYIEGHNQYPVKWALINQRLANNIEDDSLVFHRSAYNGAASIASAFWLGDQMVNWGEHDGIKSAVTGLLTASMSGMTVNHSDIGGYTTIEHPILSITRSSELLARWLELNSFGLIFRSHEGNRPDLNAQVYDERMLNLVKQSTDRFVELTEYRQSLYDEMVQSGVPPIRHPLIEYPTISRFWNLRFEQFFLGSDLLVAPVLSEGASYVDVILPPGRWRHTSSGRVYVGKNSGRLIEVAAPVGEPAAFVREGSALSSQFD